jgi:hypothetical protein
MKTEHPITPPPLELVQQWFLGAKAMPVDQWVTDVATQAARWGADQELEACLDEIYKGVGLRVINHGSDRELLCSDLRTARRPKPPSLKEQALAELDLLKADATTHGLGFDASAIRRALESLPG